MDMQQFATGAVRSSSNGKIDYEGFLSPLVLESFGKYMLKHQIQADGKSRDSDNWQKGIPQDAYMKSMFRHFMDVWKLHRGYEVYKEGQYWNQEECLTALLFNVQGYLHEYLKSNLKDNEEKK